MCRPADSADRLNDRSPNSRGARGMHRERGPPRADSARGVPPIGPGAGHGRRRTPGSGPQRRRDGADAPPSRPGVRTPGYFEPSFGLGRSAARMRFWLLQKAFPELRDARSCGYRRGRAGSANRSGEIARVSPAPEADRADADSRAIRRCRRRPDARRASLRARPHAPRAPARSSALAERGDPRRSAVYTRSPASPVRRGTARCPAGR
jgi:hypothetical protein